MLSTAISIILAAMGSVTYAMIRPSRERGRKPTAALVSLASAVALSACSGGGASTAGSAAPAPTAAPPSAVAPTDTVARRPTRTPVATSAARSSEAGGPLYRVERVVDGDTVAIAMGGGTETLRLIGMDTPETRDPRKPVQCFGREASARAERLLAGTRVRIAGDPTQDTRDRYGRLLAYVYTEGGELYNERMIREGYAHEYTYQAPYRFQARFRLAEREARELGRGLWSPDTCGGDTTQPADGRARNPTPTRIPMGDPGEPEPRPPTSGGCDPSYPDVCIPPVGWGGDLDCGDPPVARYADIRVLPPNPHGLDGNGDGRGCEGN